MSEQIDAIPETDFSSFSTTLRNSRSGISHQLNYFDQAILYLRNNPKKTYSLEEDFGLILLILAVIPSLRDHSMIKALNDATGHLSFFYRKSSELDPESYKMLLRHAKIEKFRKNEMIIRIGDIGEKFYLILKGSCYVLVKRSGIKVEKKDEIKKRKPEKAEPASQNHVSIFNKTSIDRGETTPLSTRTERNFSEGESEEDSIEDQNDPVPFPTPEMRKKFGKKHFIVRTMESGDSFGEIALQYNTERTATIITKEETYLISLSSQDYKKILQESELISSEKLVTLLSKVCFLEPWKRGNIQELLLQMSSSKHKISSFLFQSGAPIDKMFFIKKGAVELNRKVTVLRKGYFEQANRKNFELNGLVKEYTKQEELGIEEPKLFNLNEKKSDKNDQIQTLIKTTTLVEGDYFGEEMIFEGASEFNAVVRSGECELLWLSKSTFLNLIKDKETLETIRNIFEQKTKRRKASLLENVVSFCIHRFGSWENACYSMISSCKAFLSPRPHFELNLPQNSSRHARRLSELNGAGSQCDDESTWTHKRGYKMSGNGFEGLKNTQEEEGSLVEKMNRQNFLHKMTDCRNFPSIKTNQIPSASTPVNGQKSHLNISDVIIDSYKKRVQIRKKIYESGFKKQEVFHRNKEITLEVMTNKHKRTTSMETIPSFLALKNMEKGMREVSKRIKVPPKNRLFLLTNGVHLSPTLSSGVKPLRKSLQSIPGSQNNSPKNSIMRPSMKSSQEASMQSLFLAKTPKAPN